MMNVSRLMGNIPGGGMSRSASLVINLMLTMLELNQQSLPAEDFRIVAGLEFEILGRLEVKMAQQVENDYIGGFAKGVLWPAVQLAVYEERLVATWIRS